MDAVLSALQENQYAMDLIAKLDQQKAQQQPGTGTSAAVGSKLWSPSKGTLGMQELDMTSVPELKRRLQQETAQRQQVFE